MLDQLILTKLPQMINKFQTYLIWISLSTPLVVLIPKKF